MTSRPNTARSTRLGPAHRDVVVAVDPPRPPEVGRHAPCRAGRRERCRMTARIVVEGLSKAYGPQPEALFLIELEAIVQARD